MNRKIFDNIDKYYRYAKKIAGSDGNDLLHHVILLIPENVESLDSYVYTCLRNEYYNKKSKYNKLYRPERIKEEVVYYESIGYDANLLHAILLELENEGHSNAVKVFKECMFVSSVADYAKKHKINRRKVATICQYIKDEIRLRYDRLDS